MRGVAASLLVVAGCYAPDPKAGAPCTTACPTPLVCNEVTKTCERPDFVPPDSALPSAPGVFRLPITYRAAAPGPQSILVVLEAAQFPYAHASGDGSDLRFGDNDPNNGYEAPRWIEDWSSTTSRVWVRVDAATAGDNIVWAFYGQTGGAVTNDFAAVFPDAYRTTGDTTLSGDVVHDAFIVGATDTVTAMPGTPLTITAAYIKISGTIDANAAGFAAGMGSGTGGMSTTAGAGGAGHGGAGGLGGKDSGDNPGTPGPEVGAAETEEIEPGSGGGTTDQSNNNGAGGGEVQLTALRVIIDGTITANGEQGQGNGRSSGGGAGGGVLVRAQHLDFVGTIHANGGKGGQGTDPANDGGGGGGGGRIKLFSRGALVNTGTLVVTHGNGGSGGDVAPGQPGLDGTTYTGTSTSLPALPTLGVEQTL